MSVRRSRKLSTWLLVFGGLVVVAGCAWAALQLPAARSRISTELREAIRRELGLDASLGSVAVSFPLSVTGEQIRFEHPEHGLLVSAKRLEVAPSLLSLLRGKVRLKRVIIDEARVRLRVEDGEIVNLPTLTDDPDVDTTKQRRLPLRELLVRNASLEVDAAPGYRAMLSHVNIALGVTRGTLLDLNVSAESGYLEHEGVREHVNKLSMSGRVAPDKVQVDVAELDTSVFTLSLSRGFFSLPIEEDRYGAKVRVAVDLSKLARLPLGVALPELSGRVELAANVSGKMADFQLTGTLHGDNPVLEGFGFGELDLKLEANRHEVKLLEGSQGKIVQDGGLVLLKGKIGLSESLPLEVTADIKHIEFHKLMAQLGVTDNCIVNWVMRGGFELSGTANPVDVTGPIWTDTLYFRALTGAWHDPTSEEVIGTPPGRVTGRVAVRPDALRFENLRGKLPNSDLSVLVHVGFDDKIAVVARSDKFDLRDATGLMGMPLAGHGSFALDVGGTYSNTTLTGTLDLADFALDVYRVGHMRTRAILEKGGVAVRFLDTEVEKNASKYVVSDMFLDFEHGFSIDAKARFEKLALADFYHSVDIDNDPDFAPYQGTLSGEAGVRYTLEHKGDAPGGTLTIDAEMRVADATLHGVEFDGGRVAAKWVWQHIDRGTRGARLRIDDLRLTRQTGSLIARGEMDLGGALRLTLFGEKIALADLEPLRDTGFELAGELGLAGTVRGTPWTPEAQLELNLAGVRVNKRGLGDGNLRLYLTHKDDPWLARAAQNDADETTREDPCPRARRAVMEANWGSAAPKGRRPPKPSDSATTTVSLSAEKRGTQPASPPRAVLLCGTSAFGNRLDLDLALGADPLLPVRGSVGFRDVPASWILPAQSAREGSVVGQVTGQVTLTDGSALDPDTLVGEVSLASLRFGRDAAWMESDGPLRVALTGRGLRVDRARFRGEGTSLALRGEASVRQGLALELAGRFDLAVLPSVLPLVAQSSGLVDVSVKLSGPVDDPSVFGRAKLEGGSLMLTSYPMPLDKLTAQLSFSEHEVSLDDLRGTLSGGELRAHGSLTLAGHGIDRFELFATAREISLEPMSGVELAFSADTKLTGGRAMRIPELTGTVRILRAAYKRPFSLGLTERLSGLSQAKRVVRDTYDPKKDHIAFDLRIVDEAPIRVVNNLLTAELSVEDSERPFRIVGTDQRTGVLGTLSLTRGTMVFRNAQFLIESGSVTFLDETRVRPRLDVQARTEFRRTADASGLRWLISLHAYGEIDNLRLDTTSDPALAREDIALLLTVGLTRAEAERLGTTALTQGAALEALASVTGVDREVKKVVPVIDDFAVTSAYSARTNRTEPQVVVGKRLTDRVRASATAGLTADSNFKAGVQWRLNNQTSVEAGYDNVQTTTSSQFGNVGVDLRWRLEFD